MRWFWPAFVAVTYAVVVVSLFLPRGAVFGRFESVAWTAMAISVAALLAGWTWTALQLRRALPAEPRLRPVPDAEMTARMQVLDEAARELGFRPAGGPVHVDTRPETLMLSYTLEGDTIRAAVEMVRHLGAETTAFSLSTEFEGGDRLLVSTNVEKASMVPVAPEVFLQVLPDLHPEPLLEQHRRALRALERRGLQVHPVAGEGLEGAVLRALDRQREFLRATPFRHAGRLLWRSIARSPGNLVPIAQREPR